jgi:RHS repeat-associated protein
VDFYDETNSHWQRFSDALSRLTTVFENDPAGSGALTLKTAYTYNPLDNLLSVNQQGASGDTARYRTFAYDSLSRLTNACNPEALAGVATCTLTSGPWSATYTYDANSNVSTRTDARGIATNYIYDALNRITGRSYTNDPANTPALSYGYDQEYAFQQTQNEDNPVGHLNWINATVGTTNVAAWASGDYDQRGNLTGYLTCLGSNVQGCPTATGAAANIEYDLNDSITGLTGTSGGASSEVAFGYTYNRDSSDRLYSLTTYIQLDFSGTLLTSNAFSGLTFYPGGAVKTANLGIEPTSQIPAVALSRTYDNRGRITGEIDTNSLQQSAYSYSVSYDGNNNVTGYNDSVTGTWTVTNDALHRLSSMSGTVGGVATTAQEIYDNFGNRKVEYVSYGGSQSQPLPYLTFSAGNNRIDYGVYDNAGNLLYDLTNNYLYDAENRLCAVQQTSPGGDTIGYVYGANGDRLGKGNLTSFTCDLTKNGLLTANGVALTTGYDRGLQGEQLEVTDGNFNMQQYNILWEGKLLGTFAGTTYDQSNWHFALNDWVGTKRVTTKSDGTKWTSIFSGPFGDYQSQTGPGTDPSAQHFTSKERDIQSNLDYFTARDYNSNGGRFMSPDSGADQTLGVPVPFAELENPQSLNLYSYVRNNPLSLTDPDGQNILVCVDGAGSCLNYTDQGYQNLLAAQNGQQGINLPTGSMPSGNITCGGQNCGTATFFEPGLQDESGGMLMGIAGGMAADFVIGKAFGAVGSMLGRTGGEAVSGAAQGGTKVLLSSGTKQAAKDVIEGLADGAQKASAKRAVAAATRSESVSISQSADGTLSVTRTRPGFDGSQTFTKTIDSAGNSSTVQTAHDAAGNLVHYDPKN